MGRTTESGLYAALRQALERKGYLVEREFAILPAAMPKGRSVDLIGFKWADDGNLDAWAIEAKDGGDPRHVLEALPQAIEYQMVVPRVSIGSRTAGELLGYARPVLEALGIGYLVASEGGSEQVVEPGRQVRLAQSDYTQTVRHAGCILLIWRDIVAPSFPAIARRVHSSASVSASSCSARKRAMPERHWGCAVHGCEDVQIMLHTSLMKRVVLASVNAEAAPALKKIWSKFDADEWAPQFLVPGVTWVVDHDRRSYGRLTPIGAARAMGPDRATFEAVGRWAAKKQRRSGVNMVLRGSVELWAHDATPTRIEAEAAIRGALEKLLPLREALQRLRSGS